MGKLTRYLTTQFFKDSTALLLVALFLVWITQALRLFDLITAKGQGMLTLLGQAALTTPPLAREITYVCMGIGLARAMRALHDSHELHSIHSVARTRDIWKAGLTFALIGAFAVTLTAHWFEPLSKQVYADWSAQITADLVGRTLTPHQFSEVMPGFVILIGGRNEDGTITNFFANDNRDPAAQRTYSAKSAVIVVDDDGYYLNLMDGSLQFMREGEEFSEIAFSGYELSLDRFTSDAATGVSLAAKNSVELWRMHQEADAALQQAIWNEIEKRIAEFFFVLAICAFVLALSSMPHARRGNQRVPLEVTVLVVAMTLRVVSGPMGGLPTGYSSGALCLLLFSLGMIWFRLNAYRLTKLGGRAIE